MGSCISLEKTASRTDGKVQVSKCRKIWGRTVTPVPGAPGTNLKKKEAEDGSRNFSADGTSNNLVHIGPNESVIAHNMHEVATMNFHITQLQNDHLQTASHVESKEEAFFDSVAYMESDSDEDFLSVYGDFVSSAGNTLSHASSVQGTPRPSMASLKDRIFKSLSEDTLILASAEKRRKLKDFFMEDPPNRQGTEGAELTITSETRSNGVPGSKKDDDARIIKQVTPALTKATNGKHEVSKGTDDDDDEVQAQYYHEKHTNKFCLPRLKPNISSSMKRRSSSLVSCCKSKEQQ